MARKTKPLAVMPIQFCPFCGLARDGEHLLKHCINKHDGRLPLMVTCEDAEYVRAMKLLQRRRGAKVATGAR